MRHGRIVFLVVIFIWGIISLIILEGCATATTLNDIHSWEEKGNVISLISALKDDDLDVRKYAAWALSQLGKTVGVTEIKNRIN